MPKRKKATVDSKPIGIENGKLALYAVEEKDGKIIKEVIPQQDTYRLVGDEVLTENLDPECWAKALAAGVKTKDEALSVYAKLRAEELAESVDVKENKAKALEVRRLTAGAPESSYQTKIIYKRRFSLMWDFLFWQILLSVSGVGLFLGLLAMGQDSRWWPGLLPLVVVSACLQLLPVIFYGLGRWLMGRVSYIQALGFAAVMLISFGGLIGIQTLMEKKSPRWLQATLDRAVETETAPGIPATTSEEF